MADQDQTKLTKKNRVHTYAQDLERARHGAEPIDTPVTTPPANKVPAVTNVPKPPPPTPAPVIVPVPTPKQEVAKTVAPVVIGSTTLLLPAGHEVHAERKVVVDTPLPIPTPPVVTVPKNTPAPARSIGTPTIIRTSGNGVVRDQTYQAEIIRDTKNNHLGLFGALQKLWQDWSARQRQARLKKKQPVYVTTAASRRKGIIQTATTTTGRQHIADTDRLKATIRERQTQDNDKPITKASLLATIEKAASSETLLTVAKPAAAFPPPIVGYGALAQDHESVNDPEEAYHEPEVSTLTETTTATPPNPPTYEPTISAPLPVTPPVPVIPIPTPPVIEPVMPEPIVVPKVVPSIPDIYPSDITVETPDTYQTPPATTSSWDVSDEAEIVTQPTISLPAITPTVPTAPTQQPEEKIVPEPEKIPEPPQIQKNILPTSRVSLLAKVRVLLTPRLLLIGVVIASISITMIVVNQNSFTLWSTTPTTNPLGNSVNESTIRTITLEQLTDIQIREEIERSNNAIGVTEIAFLSNQNRELLGTIVLNRILPNLNQSFISETNQVRLGWYRNEPWILLRAGNRNTGLGGMLEWEATLYPDLNRLFSRSGRGTITERFTDTTQQNRDVRVLKSSSNDTLLMYGFINETTILITTSELAFINLARNVSW